MTFTRPLATPDAYVGFDNIRFNGTGFDTNGGVPEPAVWTMLLLGFATAGLMLRRARQLALAPID